MKNKTILITGSTDGIGKATALELAKTGATIIIHGRSQERVKNTVDEIKSKANNENIKSAIADFSSLEQVRTMALTIFSQYEKLDILINNAGIISKERVITKDKFELTFQVNYLSHFLLTAILLPLLQKAPSARIINVSSMVHASSINLNDLSFEKDYSAGDAYAKTKLCNILHTYKLSDILKDTNISANCLHPGVINTKLLNELWSGGSPVSEGAKALVFAATSPTHEKTSGLYLENNQAVKSKEFSYNKSIQTIFWDLSKDLLSDKGIYV